MGIFEGKVAVKPDSQLELKEALELYENGKGRRYALLFTVNGAAYTLASLLTEKHVGRLDLPKIAIGMICFTLLMLLDIVAFGSKMSNTLSGRVFAWPGQTVAWGTCLLLIAGWVFASLK